MEDKLKKQLNELQEDLNQKLAKLDELKQQKQSIIQKYNNASEGEILDLQKEMDENLNSFKELANKIEELNLKVLELKRKI